MKKYLFGLIAIAFAVTFSAFTVSPNSKKSVITLEFSGTANNQVHIPGNWDVVGESPCFDPSGIICTVEYNGTLQAFRDLVDDGYDLDDVLAIAVPSSAKYFD